MKKKLIEVALPLVAINKACAREKSIRHGHPSTLHLWWARRPLAAARDEIWQSWRRTCAEHADHPRAKDLIDRHVLPAFHDPFAGGGALPLQMDNDVPNLGKFSACRRVARTIYMGSAPLTQAAHRGIKDRRIKLADDRAEPAAKAIFESRGNTPRLYRNSLIFLAPGKTRLHDLDEVIRKYLAWESILSEIKPLNLDPQQVKQADTQKSAADGAVKARLPETYQWLLVPVQKDPAANIEWQAFRLTGQDALAIRAGKKLRNDELMIMGFAPTLLRMELDKIPLWRGNHVAVKQVVEDFFRYPYLPRLKNPAVLISAIQSGLSLITWTKDSFAYAESYDETGQRYRGLRTLQPVALTSDTIQGLLVKPEAAQKQMDAEKISVNNASPLPAEERESGSPPDISKTPEDGTAPKPEPMSEKPKRFYGTATLDTERVGRDAGRIAEEVIAHLSGLVGAKVMVTLEISAEVPAGVPDPVVRIVTENSRTLKFTSQGFEKE